MSDDFDAGPRAGEPVGSVGEEAAKLFSALAGMAKGQGTDYAGTAAGAASAVSDAMHNINEHIATDGADCKFCPVCQVIGVVRATSPEVKAHLAIAASSLMQAAAGVLATQVPADAKGSPMEKINLDDDTWDES
ncbi:MAG: hypothetical protein NTV23_05220 [Propionibacteriales bacterium]|nr:hypothetical protein [Propionibacteriales bacterium]